MKEYQVLHRVRSGYLLYPSLAVFAVCFPQPVSAQSEPPSPSAAGASREDEADIVVTARPRGTTERIDRTVYDIETGPEAASSSTVDVLRRLPGVTVGASGGVSIRAGARVGYLVDGKPVRANIALAIPASQIDRVEIIANPSAEFDSGSEALFNLILKRNANAGWSGAISAKADSLGGVRAGIDFARGGNAWALNGNLSFQSVPLRTRTLRRTEFLVAGSPGSIQIFDVDNRSTRNRLSAQVKLSRGSDSGNKTSITIGSSFSRVPQREQLVEVTRFAGGETESLLRRNLDFRGTYPFANLSAERDLGNGFKLQPSLNVFAGKSLERRRTEGRLNQLVTEDLGFMFIEPGITMVKSTKSGRLFVGATFSANPVTSGLQVSGTIPGSGTIEQTSDFEFDRDQYALFASYEGKVLGLDVKPAVRFEQIMQRFSDGSRSIAGLRSINRILPSLHVSWKLDKRNSFKASVTTRTEKPDAVTLNPFRKFLSPFFVEQGNPFLIPSTKKLFDLSHAYERKQLAIRQSLYYRDTKDDISRFVLSDDTGVTTSSFTNLGSSKTYGYSASLKVGLVKNLQVGAGADIFHKRIVAPTTLQTLGSISFTGVNVNGTADFTIDRKSSLSAQISYEGRTLDLGIETPSYTTSEIQYTRKLSKKVSLNILLADVGIPLERIGRFYGVNLNGTERSRRGSRLIRIGLATTL
jgi:outer membrane receptor for ferrienterochelin and colicin